MSALTIDIARRYLFGKKSTNSINIITGISIFGVSVGTAALILILSVFNGFEGLISGLFNAFNPDIKVSPVEGKFFDYNDGLLKKLTAIDGVLSASATLEEVALFEYRDIQEVGMIKGVDSTYQEVTALDTLMIDGNYQIKEGNIHYGMLGIGMRNKLSINIDDRITPITVYMPAKKKKLMGTKEFSSRNLYPAGVFSVNSQSDYEYIVSSYSLVSELIEKQGKASYLEIKLEPSANHTKTRDQLVSILGDKLVVKDRFQQDESTLKVMRIEKWVSFFLTGLTMLLVAFNLLGALWMIILDKRKDISVLKALGMQDHQVGWLFMQLGLLITAIGIILGFFFALFFYYIQKEFGLVPVPPEFLTESYPIQLRISDFLLVSATVMLIGAVVSILPAKKAAQNLSFLKGK